MISKFTLKSFHPGRKGIEKALGELEAKVMRFLWNNKKASVRQVRDGVSKRSKDLSFNAIMTIMNRLVDKGLLKKESGNSDNQFVNIYTATVNEKEFQNRITKDVISSVLDDASLFSASNFADVAKGLDKKTLDKLKRFLKS